MMSETGLRLTLGQRSSMDDFPVRVGVHILMNGFYIEGQQVLLTAMWKIYHQSVQALKLKVFLQGTVAVIELITLSYFN